MTLDSNTVTPGAAAPPTPPVNPNITPTGPDTLTGVQPQSANSNAPDADTQAAASIPVALINNPAVPTQKIASQIDDSKNASSPPHSALYKAAIDMAGGQRYSTSYDATGNAVRTPVPVKPWQLGLALALQVLSGGMAGAKAPANRPGQAFQNGEQVAAQKRAQI